MPDIIIVGSGPAGTSTGLHLARLAPELAARTLVLERARHPRPKLCGGGITPDAEVWLRKLGLDIHAIPHVEVDVALLRFEDREFALTAKPTGFRVVRRHTFDAWLAEEMQARGVELQEETRVQRVVPQVDGVLVETDRGSYHARVVVGADGANGVVRRAVDAEAGQRSAPRVGRLLEVLLPPDDTAPALAPAPNQAVFDFSPVARGIQGYAWDFPTLNGEQRTRNLGIYDAQVIPRAPAARPDIKLGLRSVFEQVGRSLAKYDLGGHPIRWFQPEAPLSSPRVILAGDAAGADSLFGEGLSFALAYGEVAALALREAFASGQFDFAGYRARLFEHQAGRALRRRYRVAQRFYGLSRTQLHALFGPLSPLTRLSVMTTLLFWAR